VAVDFVKLEFSSSFFHCNTLTISVSPTSTYRRFCEFWSGTQERGENALALQDIYKTLLGSVLLLSPEHIPQHLLHHLSFQSIHTLAMRFNTAAGLALSLAIPTGALSVPRDAAPEPAGKIVSKLFCDIVGGLVTVAKQRPQATSFCSSYLKVPVVTKTSTVTSFTA